MPEPRAQLSVVGWRRGQVVTGAWCRMVKLSSPSPPLYCTLHLYTTVHTLGAGIVNKMGKFDWYHGYLGRHQKHWALLVFTFMIILSFLLTKLAASNMIPRTERTDFQ